MRVQQGSQHFISERQQEGFIFYVRIHVNESKIRHTGRGGNMEFYSFRGCTCSLKQKVGKVLQMLIFMHVWSVY